jgi:hypothetical protein
MPQGYTPVAMCHEQQSVAQYTPPKYLKTRMYLLRLLCNLDCFRHQQLVPVAALISPFIILYMVDEVLTICKVAVGGWSRQLQREIVCFQGGWQRLERRRAGHSGPDKTQRSCTCRSTRMIRGCGCGFIQRTGGEAGSGARVELEKAVRGHTWFRRKPSSSGVSENGPLPAMRLQLRPRLHL